MEIKTHFVGRNETDLCFFISLRNGDNRHTIFHTVNLINFLMDDWQSVEEDGLDFIKKLFLDCDLDQTTVANRMLNLNLKKSFKDWFIGIAGDEEEAFEILNSLQKEDCKGLALVKERIDSGVLLPETEETIGAQINFKDHEFCMRKDFLDIENSYGEINFLERKEVETIGKYLPTFFLGEDVRSIILNIGESSFNIFFDENKNIVLTKDGEFVIFSLDKKDAFALIHWLDLFFHTEEYIDSSSKKL